MCFLNLILVFVLLAICKLEFIFGGDNCNPTFPKATSAKEVPATWNITKHTNFGMMRLVAGPKVGGSFINEKDSPILFLEPGIIISNVIIGKPGAKGIWCKGSCTLQNVWFESVATHAAAFGVDPLYWSNTANKYIIEGGGAQNAVEKAFIQQGAGTTIINGFYARNINKLWRSCGNCNKQFSQRHLVLNNVVVQGPILTVAGLNSNFQDTLSINNLELCNSKQISYICQAYEGTNDYGEVSGTVPKPARRESIPVDFPLNGTTCKDPSAKIYIVS